MQEFGLELLAAALLGQLDRSSRILNHLHSLKTRKFIKEPAATRVHQHRVPLHLEKPQRLYLLMIMEGAHCMIGEEGGARRIRAIEKHTDVVTPRLPRIFQQLTESF